MAEDEAAKPFPDCSRPYVDRTGATTEFVFAREFATLQTPAVRLRLDLRQQYALRMGKRTVAELDVDLVTQSNDYVDSVRVVSDPFYDYNGADGLRKWKAKRASVKPADRHFPWFDTDPGGSDEPPKPGQTRYLIWHGAGGGGRFWLTNGRESELSLVPVGRPRWVATAETY